MEKKSLHTLGKICVFFIIANLPFLTLTSLFGAQTFLDSFRYPDAYQYIKTDTIDGLKADRGYILIERPTHQGYSIKEQDIILYHSCDETIDQRVVSSVVTKNGVNTYIITGVTNGSFDGPIYEQQIIGKIKARFEDTIWTTMCMNIWEISTDNLNALVLFSGK